MTNDPREVDTASKTAPQRHTRRRTLIVASLVAAGGLATAFASNAVSQGHGFGHFRGHGGDGVTHARGPRGFFGGPMDPADAERRAERMMKHFGVEIDATNEQQEKLTALAKTLAQEVAPLRDKMRDARKQAIDLLTAPSIDRAAIEKLRAEQLTNADAMTKRVTDALADAAEVLTVEQRKSLAERIEKFRHGGGHHRGWGHRWHRG